MNKISEMEEQSKNVPNTQLVQYLQKKSGAKISAHTVRKFQEEIWQFYALHKRDLPWRQTTDPYLILVSEIMLQQTQVDRVLEKYLAFTQKFPTVFDLAEAPLSAVLHMWQGLGYNRRGVYLHQLAQRLVNEFEGNMPENSDMLQTLPGIGPYTAAAVITFAQNTPTIFIETNIRTIYLYYFFHEQTGIHDKELFPLIEKTLAKENPREWYYALMDYGSALKKAVGNPNKKSKHYTKQSTFVGSDRQIRGMILKLLLADTGHRFTTIDIAARIEKDVTKVGEIIWPMVQEGLINEESETFFV